MNERTCPTPTNGDCEERFVGVGSGTPELPVVKCETDPVHGGGKERQEPRSHSTLADGGFNKPGNLHAKLVSRSRRTGRCPHPLPARNLKVCIEALPGLSQASRSSRLSQQRFALSRLYPWKWLRLWNWGAESAEGGLHRWAGGGASDCPRPALELRVNLRSRPFNDLLQQMQMAGNTIASFALLHLNHWRVMGLASRGGATPGQKEVKPVRYCWAGILSQGNGPTHSFMVLLGPRINKRDTVPAFLWYLV